MAVAKVFLCLNIVNLKKFSHYYLIRHCIIYRISMLLLCFIMVVL